MASFHFKGGIPAGTKAVLFWSSLQTKCPMVRIPPITINTLLSLQILATADMMLELDHSFGEVFGQLDKLTLAQMCLYILVITVITRGIDKMKMSLLFLIAYRQGDLKSTLIILKAFLTALCSVD